MWNKISLYKFQQVDQINAKDIEDIDKLFFITCVVFDKTEYELDNMGWIKANKLIQQVQKIFSSELSVKSYNRIGMYKVNYDPGTMSFGQSIALYFFTQSSPMAMAHYVLASIAQPLFRKYTDTGHRERAEYFLKQPITKIVGSIKLFVERFRAFNDEYKNLFGLDKEVHEGVESDFFNKRYGWIYAATQVAEYERITMEQCFALPIRQALNDLAFLKARDKYIMEQSKRK